MLVFLSSLSNPQFHIAGGAVPVTPWQPESRQLETFKLNLTSVSNLEPCQTSTLISNTSIYLCADIEVTKTRYRSSDFLLRHRLQSLVLDFNIKVHCIWDLANPILRVGDPISDFHIQYWSSYIGLSSILGVHLRCRIPMSSLSCSDIGSTDIEEIYLRYLSKIFIFDISSISGYDLETYRWISQTDELELPKLQYVSSSSRTSTEDLPGRATRKPAPTIRISETSISETQIVPEIKVSLVSKHTNIEVRVKRFDITDQRFFDIGSYWHLVKKHRYRRFSDIRVQ